MTTVHIYERTFGPILDTGSLRATRRPRKPAGREARRFPRRRRDARTSGVSAGSGGVLFRFAVILDHYANRDVNRRRKFVVHAKGANVLVESTHYHRLVQFEWS